MQYDFQDSFVQGNNYQFHCPVTGRTMRYVTCVFMRHKQMRGEKIPAQDCACAMKGSKCPATYMQKDEWRKGERRFFDKEARLHALPRDILEQFERVQLYAFWAQDLNLTKEEAARLFSNKLSNEKGEVLPALAPADDAQPKTRGVKAKTRTRSVSNSEAQKGDLTSGLENMSDMSDMVNKALDLDETDSDSGEGA